MYPIRKDLVGKRFMCVPDKTTQNGRPNSRSNRSTNPLDYTWKCGIIRACTEEDSNNIDQKVLVEYDNQDWSTREWISVYQDSWKIFLVEKTIVWAQREDPNKPKRPVLWPALTFYSLVDKHGLEESNKIGVEFLGDHVRSFCTSNEMRSYQEDDGLQPALRNNSKVVNELVNWQTLQKSQGILIHGPFTLTGFRVQVYREKCRQWFSAVITSHDLVTREMDVMDDTVLQTHRINPRLVMVLLLANEVELDSMLRGDLVRVLPSRRNRQSQVVITSPSPETSNSGNSMWQFLSDMWSDSGSNHQSGQDRRYSSTPTTTTNKTPATETTTTSTTTCKPATQTRRKSNTNRQAKRRPSSSTERTATPPKQHQPVPRLTSPHQELENKTKPHQNHTSSPVQSAFGHSPSLSTSSGRHLSSPVCYPSHYSSMENLSCSSPSRQLISPQRSNSASLVCHSPQRSYTSPQKTPPVDSQSSPPKINDSKHSFHGSPSHSYTPPQSSSSFSPFRTSTVSPVYGNSMMSSGYEGASTHHCRDPVAHRVGGCSCSNKHTLTQNILSSQLYALQLQQQHQLHQHQQHQQLQHQQHQQNLSQCQMYLNQLQLMAEELKMVQQGTLTPEQREIFNLYYKQILAQYQDASMCDYPSPNVAAAHMQMQMHLQYLQEQEKQQLKYLRVPYLPSAEADRLQSLFSHGSNAEQLQKLCANLAQQSEQSKEFSPENDVSQSVKDHVARLKQFMPIAQHQSKIATQSTPSSSSIPSSSSTPSSSSNSCTTVPSKKPSLFTTSTMKLPISSHLTNTPTTPSVPMISTNKEDNKTDDQKVVAALVNNKPSIPENDLPPSKDIQPNIQLPTSTTPNHHSLDLFHKTNKKSKGKRKETNGSQKKQRKDVSTFNQIAADVSSTKLKHSKETEDNQNKPDVFGFDQISDDVPSSKPKSANKNISERKQLKDSFGFGQMDVDISSSKIQSSTETTKGLSQDLKDLNRTILPNRIVASNMEVKQEYDNMFLNRDDLPKKIDQLKSSKVSQVTHMSREVAATLNSVHSDKDPSKETKSTARHMEDDISKEILTKQVDSNRKSKSKQRRKKKEKTLSEASLSAPSTQNNPSTNVDPNVKLPMTQTHDIIKPGSAQPSDSVTNQISTVPNRASVIMYVDNKSNSDVNPISGVIKKQDITSPVEKDALPFSVNQLLEFHKTSAQAAVKVFEEQGSSQSTQETTENKNTMKEKKRKQSKKRKKKKETSQDEQEVPSKKLAKLSAQTPATQKLFSEPQESLAENQATISSGHDLVNRFLGKDGKNRFFPELNIETPTQSLSEEQDQSNTQSLSQGQEQSKVQSLSQEQDQSNAQSLSQEQDQSNVQSLSQEQDQSNAQSLSQEQDQSNAVVESQEVEKKVNGNIDKETIATVEKQTVCDLDWRMTRENRRLSSNPKTSPSQSRISKCSNVPVNFIADQTVKTVTAVNRVQEPVALSSLLGIEYSVKQIKRQDSEENKDSTDQRRPRKKSRKLLENESLKSLDKESTTKAKRETKKSKKAKTEDKEDVKTEFETGDANIEKVKEKKKGRKKKEKEQASVETDSSIPMEVEGKSEIKTLLSEEKTPKKKGRKSKKEKADKELKEKKKKKSKQPKNKDEQEHEKTQKQEVVKEDENQFILQGSQEKTKENQTKGQENLKQTQGNQEKTKVQTVIQEFHEKDHKRPEKTEENQGHQESQERIQKTEDKDQEAFTPRERSWSEDTIELTLECAEKISDVMNESDNADFSTKSVCEVPNGAVLCNVDEEMKTDEPLAGTHDFEVSEEKPIKEIIDKLAAKKKKPNKRKKKNQDDGKEVKKRKVRVPTEDFFVQNGGCTMFPKLPQCRDCRDKDDITKSPDQNCCRFTSFRRLKKKRRSGKIQVAGFMMPDNAENDDLNPWIAHDDVVNVLTKEEALYILSNIGDEFCSLVQEEKHVLVQEQKHTKKYKYKKHKALISYKRAVVGLREMCDACATTIFNMHWVCHRCGFGVCLDCYNLRVKEKDGTQQFGRRGFQFKWFHCIPGVRHQPKNLTIAQIIPKEALTDLSDKLHHIRSHWNIPEECPCRRKEDQLTITEITENIKTEPVEDGDEDNQDKDESMSIEDASELVKDDPNSAKEESNSVKEESNLVKEESKPDNDYFKIVTDNFESLKCESKFEPCSNPSQELNTINQEARDNDSDSKNCVKKTLMEKVRERIKERQKTDSNTSQVSSNLQETLEANETRNTKRDEKSEKRDIERHTRDEKTQSMSFTSSGNKNESEICGSGKSDSKGAGNEDSCIDSQRSKELVTGANNVTSLSSGLSLLLNYDSSSEDSAENSPSQYTEGTSSTGGAFNFNLGLLALVAAESDKQNGQKQDETTLNVKTSESALPDSKKEVEGEKLLNWFKKAEQEQTCAKTEDPVNPVTSTSGEATCSEITMDTRDQLQLDMPISNETYPALHSFMCNGRLLRLHEPQHPGNEDAFAKRWIEGKPILISNIDKLLNKDLWSPESFEKEFGDEISDVVNCRNGKIVENFSVGEFWKGFESVKDRAVDSSGLPMLLKLKDWPPGTDFCEKLPSRFKNLMDNIPLPAYTRRDGLRNLASRLPDFFVKPDLGPKMYNAYGSAAFPNEGTTNLHIDMSDAVNIMVYVGVPRDTGAGEREREAAIKAVDVACDKIQQLRVRRETARIGALWHIFEVDDADKIREFLLQVAKERKLKYSTHQDPIHDQCFYLDEELRTRLKTDYNVEGYAICQCLGDGVFIPAGAPHQVRNLYSCVKIAEDFVSPERIGQCFKTTQEFRHLSDKHTNHEDKLQIKNIIYHAVKDAVCVLQHHEQQSKEHDKTDKTDS